MNYQDDMGQNLPHAGSPRPAPPGILSSPHWLVIGLLVAAVGVVMLFIPVSATVNGTKVGCGSAVMPDDGPATRYSIANSAQAMADIMGYEYTGKRVGNDSPTSKCADRLTLQRWIAWPMVIIGAGLAVRGVVNRRDERASGAWARASRSAAARPPLPEIDAPEQFETRGPRPASDTPRTAPSHLPPPTGPPVHVPRPITPGWYQCPEDSRMLRWHNGRQWTVTTQPHPN